MGAQQRPFIRVRGAVAAAFVAALLAGCGKSTSVDYAERAVEDTRREEARSAEVAAAVAEREVADEAFDINGPGS